MSGKLITILKDKELANSGVFEHLTQLIRGSVENKSDLKGLSNIEIFSYYLRKNKFSFEQFLKEDQLALAASQEKVYHPYVSAVKELQNKLAKIDDHRVYQRPDLMQQCQALKLAGVGIGETNAYHLQSVIKELSIEHQTKDIRFWGKILGYKDYWVIQGSSSQAYLSDLPQNGEKYGSGVNTYSYWVTTEVLGKWIELPLVTPEQVVGSRSMKYIFTGRLEDPVFKSKQFVGQEKHLLKCVIARITHSCELAPKGLYKPNEENANVIEFEDEFKLGQVAELNSPDAWVHLNAHILSQGRCSHYIDPKLPEEQKEALTAELGEKDPMVERLKGISEDKPYEAMGFAANWSNAIAGETIPVNQIGKQEGTTLVYGVACLRNQVWPGAVTLGYRGGWTNIYVGYGHRLSQQINSITELKDVQVQAQDPVERPQPNPSKAPAPVQQKKQEQPKPQQEEA